jgi:hypothetical protein
MCNIFSVEVAHARTFGLSSKYGASVLNVDTTGTEDKLQIVFFSNLISWHFPTSLTAEKTVQSLRFISKNSDKKYAQ